MFRFAARIVFSGALLFGCSAAPGGGSDEATGSIDLALSVAGVTIDRVSYAITGASYDKAGSFDVTNSTRISAVIGGIPVGSYQITLQAVTEGTPQLTCLGSASFVVVARMTTTTHVDLLCRAPVTNGSVMVNGSVRICPIINAISATPAETRVGGAMILSGLTDEPDDSGAVPFSWQSSGGLLSYEQSLSPTLTCTAPGPITVTFTIDEGQPCEVSDSLLVMCSASSTPPQEDDPNTAGDDRAGYTACGGQSCAPGFGCCIDGPNCGTSDQACASPFAFQSCDGPEDCSVGTQCAISSHAIACAIPSPYFGIFCHTDADCDQNASPNPCTEGVCNVPFL